MFRTHYYDSAYVSRDVKRENGKTIVTYTVNTITGIYDFTLAADPAPAARPKPANFLQSFARDRKTATRQKRYANKCAKCAAPLREDYYKFNQVTIFI